MSQHDLENELKIADDTLSRAYELFQAKQDEAALSLYRAAVNQLLAAFQQHIDGGILTTLLLALRSLAVTAFITGRTEEGRIALGTAMAHVELGLKNYWPSAQPLLDQQAELLKLADQVGETSVLIFADDDAQWTWPFSD